MQKNMTDRTPGSYDDFVAYLGTVRTEEELFSRLTYWFAGQNRPEDVLSRSELVEARAKAKAGTTPAARRPRTER